MQRVEVLRPGNTSEFEFWTNSNGSIYLCREKSEEYWQAIVDGDVVMDLTGTGKTATMLSALTSPTASGLVPALALQQGLHLLLDHDSLGQRRKLPA